MTLNQLNAARVPSMIPILLLCIFLPLAEAQPAFSVGSIRLVNGRCSSAAPCNGGYSVTPTGVIFHGYSLGYLIRWAYGLNMYEPSEVTGPDWIEPGGEWVRYDVSARTDSPVAIQDLKTMMQSFLAERLHLSIRRGARDMQVYVLSLNGSAPKLHRSEGDSESAFIPPGPDPDGVWWWGGESRFEHYRMSDLYDFLWRFVPAPIVDETGLEGQYDFSLNMPKFRNLYEPPIAGGRADLGPALGRAFAELGLRFETRRRRMEILIIDHAERKPTDN